MQRERRLTWLQREIAGFVFARCPRFEGEQLLPMLAGAGILASRATVYRTLHLLVDNGTLRRSEVNGTSMYAHERGR